MIEKKHTVLPNGISITYYSDGIFPTQAFPNDQKITIFLHGLTNSALTWRPLMPLFRAEHHLNIYLDLPGHGESTRGDFKYDIPFYTETVVQFIKKFDFPKVNLIGHSLGGQIAIDFALHFKGLVEKIVLIAPAGFETFSFLEKSMLERAVSFPVTLSSYLHVLRPTYKASIYLPPIEQILHDSSFINVISKSVKGMLRNPVFVELSELELPVLVIFGKEDQAIPNPILHPTLTTLKVAQQGTKQLQKGILEIIEHAGHFVHLQQPELVVEKIDAFLNQR